MFMFIKFADSTIVVEYYNNRAEISNRYGFMFDEIRTEGGTIFKHIHGQETEIGFTTSNTFSTVNGTIEYEYVDHNNDLKEVVIFSD